MIVRFLRAERVARLLVLGSFSAVITSAGACSDDPSGGPSAQVQKYCQDLFASPAFACCSDGDRQDRQFGVRYRYSSAADCADALTRESNASQGRQSFDSEAASSCLAHLGSRKCGVTPTAAVRTAEEKAGCSRILVGKQAEGQPCNTSGECKTGLVCPPAKATGGSTCAKPGAANEGCVGASTSVDHPPCQANLFCSLVGENPVCPAPPCLDYKCVPFAEDGEDCLDVACADGLSCREGKCNKGGASPAGGVCRVLEHCEEGLFCDPITGQCAARKATGAECRTNANSLFECKGICKQASDGPGTCSAFCGSE